MPDNYNPGQEAVRVTASPNLITERAGTNGGSVDQLLAALGIDSVRNELNQFQQNHEAQKLQEQKAKFDWYVEQFNKDHTSGAVSQAQVKERFPETVPIIASRIAEAIGAQAGRKQFQTAIDEVNSNDALRLDSAARSKFLSDKRAEMVGNVPQGNDFYGAGIVGSIDRLMAQHEQQWSSETAAYHQKVQQEEFSQEVSTAFNNGKPESLVDVDAKWGKSSSLNNLERKKLVVSTAIDLAIRNDDPAILTQVPQLFLSAGAKADLEKARIQIQGRRMSDYRNAMALKEDQRQEARRTGELRILEDLAAGRPIDPLAPPNRSDPQLYEFALRMRDAPRLDESVSKGNAGLIRQQILAASTVGPGESLGSLTDKIAATPNLNAKDKQDLIAELPKLMEGQTAMSDPMVRQPFQDRLNPRLSALESTPNQALQSMLSGRNLRAESVKQYDTDIRRFFLAFYEDNGRWPTGAAKQDLIDKATDRAEKYIEQATKLAPAGESINTSGRDGQHAALPGQDAIAAELARRKASIPSASKVPLPKGVTKLD